MTKGSIDSFQGDDEQLVSAIDALLALEDSNSLRPHPLGGRHSLTYTLLYAARQRLDLRNLIKADDETFEHFTCATGHLSAERTLRIIESATRLGESISNDAIMTIHMLADQAGVAAARAAIEGGGAPF